MLPIAQELGWAPGVQGVVQSAFLWGYLATQLLGGTLADKYGGAPLVLAAPSRHGGAQRSVPQRVSAQRGCLGARLGPSAFFA